MICRNQIANFAFTTSTTNNWKPIAMPNLNYIMLAVLTLCHSIHADAQEFRLTAPANWGGETITLPPGFAKDMSLKGVEHIRFAPGMMDAQSDTFFCYAFAFELQSQPKLTEETVKAEFLKYYRGLSKAVLNGKPPEKDFAEFGMELEVSSPSSKKPGDTDTATVEYVGKLEWVEPFATKKSQQLNVEIRTWSSGDRNYLFASVSPQKRDAAIWLQLRKIRDDYIQSLNKR